MKLFTSFNEHLVFFNYNIFNQIMKYFYMAYVMLVVFIFYLATNFLISDTDIYKEKDIFKIV